MFQQLINPIKLETVTKFLHMLCRTEYAIGELFPSVHNQGVESNLEVWKIVNQYRMRFLKIH